MDMKIMKLNKIYNIETLCIYYAEMHAFIKTRTGIFTGIVVFILIFYKGLQILISWNIPCYDSNAGDALPSAEDVSFSPKNSSIFFHETSCRGGLNIRQACSVEAAARAHPEWQVYVLFSSSVTYYTLKSSCLAKLQQLHNVNFARVHIAEYSKGTMAQSILLNDLKESLYPIQHSADILRILTLNKWGGIYLDTDMIVTRSLKNLPPNFVTKETSSQLATGVLAFAQDQVGKKITNSIIREMRKDYVPDEWSTNGASAIENVIYSMCPEVIDSPSYKKKPISNCEDIAIFDFELFYPLFYSDLEDTFELPAVRLGIDLERPYTYHMWNFVSSKRRIFKHSVYDVVAERYCPSIYTAYRDEFGAEQNAQPVTRNNNESNHLIQY